MKEIPETVCRGTVFNDADVFQVEQDLSKLGFKQVYLTVASPSLLKQPETTKQKLETTEKQQKNSGKANKKHSFLYLSTLTC